MISRFARRSISFMLLVVAPLAAQTPSSRRAVDSLLLSLNQITTRNKLPANLSCLKLPVGAQQDVCRALITLRASVIDMQECDSECRSFRKMIFDRSSTYTISQANVASAAGELKMAQRDSPNWAPVWFGFGLVAARAGRRDSALVLLRRARGFDGMSKGVIDLEMAKLLFQTGRADSGLAALQRAASDTASVAKAFVNGALESLLPSRLSNIWDTLPIEERATWLGTSPVVRPLLQAGLGQVPFPNNIALLNAHSYGEANGGGAALIAFALDRVFTRKDRIVADSIGVHVTAIRESDGAVFSLDTLRRFSMQPYDPRRLAIEENTQGMTGATNLTMSQGKRAFSSASQFLPMVQEVPLPPGDYLLFATVTKTAKIPTGSTVMLKSIVIPDTKATVLSASTLILGWEKSGVAWHALTRDVPMNPFGEWPGDGVATMYTQVRGLAAGQPFQVTVQLFAIDAKQHESTSPAFTLSFEEKATSNQTDWTKQLGLGQLREGDYRVQVTVKSGGNTAVTSDRMKVVR